MNFELTNEKATNVLIWWIESADGSIDYREEETVKKILDGMDYSMEAYYQDAKLHISGLSIDKIEQLVEQSIQWGNEHFSEKQKKDTLALLKIIAESNERNEEEQEKLDRIEQGFGG